ncbi:thiazole synthase [Candidatus Marinamargulisbacteria bacterium SCGC AG-414-C22]|nr:thiazole synthase [Candidatus Marinamargulisbacteria bacterium SCGC AG-414-C22]
MDKLKIGNNELSNRLLLGTGKFASNNTIIDTIAASETEIITVAVRRVDLNNAEDSFLKLVNPEKIIFMPNTSGARNAEDAVRCATIARVAAKTDFIKLEVTPDQNHLMPDPIETLKAAEILVKKGFTVLPYIHADPILAKRCEDVGCAAVMPLGAPIGTNLGLETDLFVQIIIDQAKVPVIVDAGIGAPSQACRAMEMGASAVLVNTAIATARNPVKMAIAFKEAVKTGRDAYLAGLATAKKTSEASSPLTGFLN